MRKGKEVFYMKYAYKAKKPAISNDGDTKIIIMNRISNEISKNLVMSMARSLSGMSYNLSKQAERGFLHE